MNPYQPPLARLAKPASRARWLLAVILTLAATNIALFAFGAVIHHVYCNHLTDAQRAFVQPALKTISSR